MGNPYAIKCVVYMHDLHKMHHNISYDYTVCVRADKGNVILLNLPVCLICSIL